MNTEKTLRPCPFCGGAPFKWCWGLSHFVIQCSNYKSDTHQVGIQADSIDEAVGAWNRRVTDDG